VLFASHDLVVSGEARFPATAVKPRGAQRIELEFWGLEPQFSCSSGLDLVRFRLPTPASQSFPGEGESESQFWGLLPQNEPFRRHGLAMLSQAMRSASDALK